MQQNQYIPVLHVVEDCFSYKNMYLNLTKFKGKGLHNKILQKTVRRLSRILL